MKINSIVRVRDGVPIQRPDHGWAGTIIRMSRDDDGKTMATVERLPTYRNDSPWFGIKIGDLEPAPGALLRIKHDAKVGTASPFAEYWADGTVRDGVLEGRHWVLRTRR